MNKADNLPMRPKEWYYNQLSKQSGKILTNFQIAQEYANYLLSHHINVLAERKYSEEDMYNAFYNGWLYRGEDYTFPKAKEEWLKNLNEK